MSLSIVSSFSPWLACTPGAHRLENPINSLYRVALAIPEAGQMRSSQDGGKVKQPGLSREVFWVGLSTPKSLRMFKYIRYGEQVKTKLYQVAKSLLYIITHVICSVLLPKSDKIEIAGCDILLHVLPET